MKNKKPIDSRVIYQNAQLEAIEGVLTNTPDAFERKVRRWFSKTFSTPYQDTFKLSWPELLRHYYEESFNENSYNELFDIVVQQYLPEFVDAQEQDDQQFADSLLDEQKATIKKKKEKDRKQQALEAATNHMANSASNVVDKAQSISKQLDDRNNAKPITKISKKFDFDHPDEES